MIVYAADGATPLILQPVAVIFAPGAQVRGQSRNPAVNSLCPTTGTTIAQNLCATNYLDTAGVVSNGNPTAANGPFINAPLSSSFNDRLVTITTSEFMPQVEIRVADTVKQLLTQYQASSQCKCYPWADSFVGADGTSNAGVNRGRFPQSALPEPWGQGGPFPIPNLPAWFGAPNNWGNVIYYSVGKQYSQEFAVAGPTFGCTTCGIDNALTVDGTATVPALFFMPGTPLASVIRPTNVLTDYLHDLQNSDGMDNVYVTPTALTFDRNRIATLVAVPRPLCSGNVMLLLQHTPCGVPPHRDPVCVSAAASLATCTCAAAANVVINVPCENTLHPPQCQAAIATLTACNT